MAYETPIPDSRRSLDCEEWTAMLSDVLDGTLPGAETAAFFAHKEACLACAQLLEEARRGTEWLAYLRPEPEVPSDLVDKILARTSAAVVPEGLPALAGGPTAIAGQQSWFSVPYALIQRHATESRLLMTVAMAFFSIAFTLNLLGVHLNQLRLTDLKPSALATTVSRQYYTASAQLMRYYSSIRFVYEVESRVNEIRQNAQPEPVAPTPAPSAAKPSQAQPSQPQAPHKGDGAANNSGGGAAQAPASGKRLLHLLPQRRGTSATQFVRPAAAVPACSHTRKASARVPLQSLRVHACTPQKQDQAERSLA